MTEPQPGDTIRARRYGNQTRRTYVIDRLAYNGTQEAIGGGAYAAWVRPKGSAAAATLAVFDAAHLRIIQRKDQR